MKNLKIVEKYPDTIGIVGGTITSLYGENLKEIKWKDIEKQRRQYKNHNL